jgi:uncharacterized protein
MRRSNIAAVLCVLLLLSVASAGCTVSLPSGGGQSNSSVSSGSKTPSSTGVGSTHMLALEELDVNSYAGAVSDVNVSIEPGAGYVFVATKPLTGSDFQETAQTAADVAAARAHVDLSRQDIKFVVHVPEKVDAVDGPSAGLPMAIAVYSAITKMPTNKYVYGTGTIESDGRVNRVGGVYWKASAAAESGAKVIIVPSNETVVNTTNPLATSGGVNLQSELRKNGYNVTVVGVKNIDEALPYYFS